MPYKQIIRSELPNSETVHFLFLAELVPVLEFIRTLRMAYAGKILSMNEVNEGLVIQNTIVWASKEDLDSYTAQLIEAFPTLHSVRDQYHADKGINFTVTYEEI